MATEEQVVPESTNTPSQTAEPSLRDTIASAMETADKKAVQPAPESPEGKAATESDRDPETGKFKKGGKPGKAAKTASPDGAAQPEDAIETPEQTEGETEAKTPPTDVAPPKHWSEKDKAEFSAIKTPEDAMRFTMRRYKDMEADYTRRVQQVAHLQREYEPVAKMFEPHRQQLQQAGLTEGQVIQKWASAEQYLQREPLKAVVWLANSYGVTADKLYQALSGGQPQNGQSAEGQQPAANDPRVDAVLQELGAIKQHFGAQERAQQERALSVQREDINEFADEAGTDGQPLRPFFDEVVEQMCIQAQAMRASGLNPTLQDLYDTAVWANPSTREKLIAAQQSAASAKAAEQAKAKASAARRAGSSVSGSPVTGQTPTPVSGSLRGVIEQAFERHSAA